MGGDPEGGYLIGSFEHAESATAQLVPLDSLHLRIELVSATLRFMLLKAPHTPLGLFANATHWL